MGFINLLKTISGIKAYEAHKETKVVKTKSETKLNKYQKQDIYQRHNLNLCINEFGRFRLAIMKNTVGDFLNCLDIMNQQFKEKTYHFLEDVDILAESYINEVKSLHITSTNILMTTAKSASIGAAALSGVPTIITAGVGQLATASTGTAISTLAGAAKTNAILAWLGGGSLVTGGGGVAAGTTLLTTVTWTATGGLAIIAAGIIVSKHYDNKLTEIRNYEKEVDIHCAQLESNWEMIALIKRRIKEISDITEILEQKIIIELELLKPLITDFDTSHPYHIRTFQKAAILVKAMSENVQVPLLTSDGRLTTESNKIILKTKEILNKDLIK